LVAERIGKKYELSVLTMYHRHHSGEKEENTLKQKKVKEE
jgi:hypothetical protein